MPDTKRSLSSLQTLLADNTAGDISAQDVRDFLVSVYPIVLPQPQGRLTTESGVAVSTSDRTSQSTIYYTPYTGNGLWLYDGTIWQPYTFTERSLSLSGLTSGKNYDVFIYDNAGTVTLELSAAWTTDTARADALTTQDGVYVKSGATTRRWLGTIRTTSTTATEDSLTKRFVWNAHNQINRQLRKADATASWTYATANVWRSANNSTSNRVEVVCGSASAIDLEVVGLAFGNASVSGHHSIGEDSTSTPASEVLGMFGLGYSSTILSTGRATLQKNVVGYHYYQWLEGVDGSATVTFYGTESTGLPRYRTGIYGVVNG